jgi:Peptidase family M28
MNRRGFLAYGVSALAALAQATDRTVRGVAEKPEDRIARIVRTYSNQGDHRTGTVVDQESGDWLRHEIELIGVSAHQESFSFGRIDQITTHVKIDDRVIEGLPLFDGGFTDAQGVRGRLGALGTDMPIALTDLPVNAAGTGALLHARRASKHQAIIAITRGRSPGLCPSNADYFPESYGPPVVQVSSEEAAWLTARQAGHTEAQVVAHISRNIVRAANVIALVKGTKPTLRPLIVMTPRSGWYSCASERGGGIACWLEVMRQLRAPAPVRPILFVASTGHELGFLGIKQFIAQHPGIVSHAEAWLQLGSDIGSANNAGYTLQASDDDLDNLLSRQLTARTVSVDRHIPHDVSPLSEVLPIYQSKGRFISIYGDGAYFHSPDDKGSKAVIPRDIANISAVFGTVARALSD